jgi:hypothetical protein
VFRVGLGDHCGNLLVQVVRELLGKEGAGHAGADLRRGVVAQWGRVMDREVVS